MRDKIINRLKSLEEIPDIAVTISKRAGNTVRIIHNKHHAPEFRFQWNKDHFIGYFIDGEDSESQAVISIRTPMDAIKFVSAYSILNDLRAKQPA